MRNKLFALGTRKLNLKLPLIQNGRVLFFMQYCSIFHKWFIHLFSDDVFTDTRVGQSVTHIRSQQWQTTTIWSIPGGHNHKSRLTVFKEEKIITISVSSHLK